MKSANNKQSLHGKIIGGVFLIWFFASIIALIVFSQINVYYTIMIMGQYFLVFGLIPLFFKGATKLISIPFLLVGLSLIIIPFMMMNPSLFKEIDWPKIIVVLFLSGFILTGIALITISIITKKRLEKVCTLTVWAKIVDYNTTVSEKGNTLYSPIYLFELGKKKYRVSNEIYTNINVKERGTLVELKVNPDNPNEFLDNNKVSLFSIILGILFLISSVPVLLYILYR